MKSLTFRGLILLPLFLIALLTSCSDDSGKSSSGDPVKRDQAAFSAGEDLSKLITDADFTQAATGAEGTGVTIYYSNNETVATVDSNGLVHIVDKGIAAITAYNPGDDEYNPASDSYLLTVSNPEFITRWQATNSFSNAITILVYEGETYNYDVDWGDGSYNTGVTGATVHTYNSEGIYTVKITGDFPGIYFDPNVNNSHLAILSIEQWGAIKWTSMNRAFYNCPYLTCNASDTPDLSQVTDMSFMFNNATSFNGDVSTWDVSSVADMGAMFYGANVFNGDVSNWDVSSVTTMNYMFYDAYSFTEHDLSGWDVDQVTGHTDFSTDWGSGNTEPDWPDD
ncbi:MAG TPA: BspA family leucine-rich repeat surface protein [Spirochaetota bacterium]|nr:BspA family leucine-rich repeat surface protein [Spirochaetota bacterium]